MNSIILGVDISKTTFDVALLVIFQALYLF